MCRCPLPAAVALAAAVLLCGASVRAEAGLASPPTPAVQSRLRGADPGAREVLAAGLARSPTFRAIARTLESSDVIVYIETRSLRRSGQLQFVGATPGARYVRVAVQVPGREEELVGWLAHELWHAVEIARARDVRSEAGLSVFYRRVGTFSLSGGEVETEQARVVQARVVAECREREDGRGPLATLWHEPHEQRLLAELQPRTIARARALSPVGLRARALTHHLARPACQQAAPPPVLRPVPPPCGAGRDRS